MKERFDPKYFTAHHFAERLKISTKTARMLLNVLEDGDVCDMLPKNRYCLVPTRATRLKYVEYEEDIHDQG